MGFPRAREAKEANRAAQGLARGERDFRAETVLKQGLEEAPVAFSGRWISRGEVFSC